GGEADDWLTATVRFDEPGCAGALVCALPAGLARTLFDAFNGRDPIDPEPPVEDVLDLVGELSNMICGAWLTRLVNHQSFLLRRPLVSPLFDRARLDDAPPGRRLTMRVNELPIVIDVDVHETEAIPA
ncbi:MAG TPA: chemotaxis protein CheX, partial [Vicinamibacterales bacterium]|nr:chemotaxis protein CheX [Vicinamibacterales bacterium]